MELTRRRMMIASAAGGTGAVSSLAALAQEGGENTLTGGDMALSEATRVAGDLWIGPKAARSDIDPPTGAVFMASDVEVDYHYDGSSWVAKGVGSSEEAVPSVNTESVNGTVYWATESEYPRWYDVNNLVDDVPSGATIALEAREYPLDFEGEGAVTLDRPDISLVGHGWSSVVRLEDGTTNSNEGANILEITADNVTISNFRIDGNWTNNDPGESGDVQDGHNIAAQGVANFRAEGVWSNNGTGDGIELVNSSACKIINSKFNNNWEHGIGLNGAQDCQISGCYLDGEENNGLIDTWNGTNNDDTQDIQIEACTLRNGANAGLTVDGGDGAVRNVSVEDVTIENCTAETFAVLPGNDQSQVPGVTVRDCRFINSDSGFGVRIDGVRNFSMSDCVVRDNPKHGIRLRGPVTNAEIRENQIINNNQNNDNGRGIVVLVPDGTTLEEVQIEDNTIKSEATPYHQDGIQSTGAGTFTDTYYVRDNTITNVQGEAVAHSFPQRPRIELRNGSGVLEDAGTSSSSGDGSATSFNISHKLPDVPSQYVVTPLSADAAADHYVSDVNSNVIEVTYLSAPPSGTDNLQWSYRVVSD